MGEVIRIVIVDDDPLVHTGLGLILGGTPNLEVVAEASDGEAALSVVAEHTPDVVLMDIRMPHRDGLSATAEILKRPNPPKIIVLTTFDSDDMVMKALAAGASGFLLKDTPPAKMVAAIQSVIEGEPTLSPSVIEQVIRVATQSSTDSRKEEALADLAELNDREREVALAIGHGLSNADIAAQHYMSVATVKAHITKIFDKLGVDNRVQVAMKVHDAGLA